MIRSQSETIDKMYEIVGVGRKTYSPQEYAKEEGTYEPGCMWPQYFFDAYPIFTKEKQYDIMMVYLHYVDFGGKYNPDISGFDYAISFDNITVNGQTFPDGLAQLVIETYPKLKYDLQEEIREILCR